jgi:hypothetical protein
LTETGFDEEKLLKSGFRASTLDGPETSSETPTKRKQAAITAQIMPAHLLNPENFDFGLVIFGTEIVML